MLTSTSKRFLSTCAQSAFFKISYNINSTSFKPTQRRFLSDQPIEKLVGTVKPYSLQLGILTQQSSWPVKIFQTSDFHKHLFNLMRTDLNLFTQVRLNNVYKEPIHGEPIEPVLVENKDRFNVLIFPTLLKLAGVDREHLPQVVDILIWMLKSQPTQKDLLNRISSQTNLTPKILPSKHHLLVCTHNEVDCRCGTLGLEVYNNLANSQSSQEGNLSVYRVSHIGGHKYAGNVISYPDGNWFGNLNLEKVPKFLDQLKRSEIDWDLWRGKYNLSKEDQLKLHCLHSQNK